MQSLFGDLCLGKRFRHDDEMMKIYEAGVAVEGRQKRSREESPTDTQMTEDETASPTANNPAGEEPVTYTSNGLASNTPTKLGELKVPSIPSTSGTPLPHSLHREVATQSPRTDTIYFSSKFGQEAAASDFPSGIDAPAPISQKRQRTTKRTNRQLAYDAAIGENGLSWSDFGGLESTRSKDIHDEQEL
jgi:hypothetical protein